MVCLTVNEKGVLEMSGSDRKMNGRPVSDEGHLDTILEGLRSGSYDPDEALRMYRKASEPAADDSGDSCRETDVAIIGVAGRYPRARDLTAFWDVLAGGEDCVSEIPPERWDAARYYSPDPRAVGKTVSKWGGFLDNVDQFDAPFFSISPREAELMDPQQRLFLQEAWTALEEAGYASADLDEQKCGVFVGCGPGDYYRRLEQEDIDSHAYSFMGNAPSILAARIAYLLNLRGASIVVDTACSSSLVAIHLACESIRSGECVMALAGGVSIFVTPQFHLLSGKAGMLSPEGRCRAFDDDANGFVPAEGVGVIVLKRLSSALEDGDHIHGVIRGSGINQDGRTTGITAPSAPSQADLEREIYKKYGITPESISFVECHGTGTKLGDPIEIQGLSEAFRDCEGHQCAVGSVKSNIGHALTAAGIAGVTKVLLCLKNRQLVPSVHVGQENRHIDFSSTPFYVNKELRSWETDGAKRRAAVSSFGFSGTNAHLVIEEAPDGHAKGAIELPAYPIPISGASEQSCRQRIADLRQFLATTNEVSLHDLAFTLSVGRNHFRFRYCPVVDSIESLEHLLAEQIDRLSDSKEVAQSVGESLQIIEVDLNELEGQVLRERLEVVCELYCAGRKVEWKKLFATCPGRRLSLPTYPFETRRYWIPELDSASSEAESDVSKGELDTVGQTQVSGTFTLVCGEFYFRDHVIGGISVFPGMAYLALAGQVASKGAAGCFSEIQFQSPLIASSDVSKVTLAWRSNLKEGRRQLEFVGHAGQVHASMVWSEDEAWEEAIDLGTLRARCETEWASSDVYDRFARLGVEYGPSFRVIEKLWCSDDVVIAELNLNPTARESELDGMVTILDGALQSVVGLTGNEAQDRRYLPARIGELRQQDPCPETRCFAVARKGGVQSASERSFNIDVTDENGRVWLKIRDFVVTVVASPTADRRKQTDDQVSPVSVAGGELVRRVLNDMAQLVSSVLKIPAEEVSATDDLSEYGFDSISLTELSNQVLDLFDIQLSAAIFFEHSTLGSFADYLVETHGERLRAHYHVPDQVTKVAPSAVSVPIQERPFGPAKPVSERKADSEAIAVVGIAGVFPQCGSVEEFWQALAEGRDLISEVPADRWDWRAYSGDPQKEINKTRVNCGGFVKDVGGFDAAFFGISPREAELMDPQHRLFLETVWRALEDAAIRPSDLSGSKTGVFVGIASQDYKEILGERGINIDAYAATGMAHCLAANRISYLLNLHGPSEAIDTACSSSLVAVHRAVAALRDGTCDVGLAGGVNLLLTPSLFISFDRAGMLSPDGRCKPFDSRANGYARGEGAGVIVLKRLSQAEADGDHIYSVIRGSGVNHGGRANSLTAPNPKAQAQLLIDTYSKAGIDPSTVSYIEAHGTGTSLGDPVEFNGLKRAFAGLAEDFDSPVPDQNCALGSVKGNIGHLETAAGIAGLMKVILGIKNRFLPPTVHYREANPLLDLAESPFHIVREGREWLPLEQNGQSLPLRAGVSSFGFGGANAHVIVEEYQAPSTRPDTKVAKSPITTNGTPEQVYVIPLSARSAGALGDMARDLVAHLTAVPSERLADVALTLQSGRQAFKYRVAFLCTRKEELLGLLHEFREGDGNANIMTAGSGSAGLDDGLFAGVEAEEFIAALARKGKWAQIAKLWVHQGDFTWPMTQSGNARRVPLPGYPFQHERFWYQAPALETAGSSVAGRKHPLVAENVSTLSEQKYRLGLSGQESVFRDHVIGGISLLPATAQIEMALFAGADASGRPVQTLKNVSWNRALRSEDAVGCYVTLVPNDQETSLEIWSEGRAGTRIVYSSCSLDCEVAPRISAIDFVSVRERCSRSIEPRVCYERFANQTVSYGGSFQVMRSLNLGSNELLAELALGENADCEDYRVSPELLDGALQAVAVLMADKADGSAWVPRKIERISLWDDIPSRVFVHASALSRDEGETRSFDIRICDDAGKVLGVLEGLQFQALGLPSTPVVLPEERQPIAPVRTNQLFFQPVWESAPLPEMEAGAGPSCLVLGAHEEIDIPGEYQQVRWGNDYLVDEGELSIRRESDGDFRNLLSQLITSDRWPDVVVVIGTESGADSVAWEPVRLCHAWASLAVKKPLKLLYFDSLDAEAGLNALGAFARTLAAENSRFAFTSVATGEPLSTELMRREIASLATGVQEIRHVASGRTKRTIREFPRPIPADGSLELRASGCYLITGGGGKLGLLFAESLGQQTSAPIILTGRSELDTPLRERLAAMAGTVTYQPCDVSDGQAVRELVASLRQQFGDVNGVLHIAGFTRDGLLREKATEEFRSVLKPKVDGLIHLDAAIGDGQLDFLVTFSSVAAVIGNPGQTDYAMANGFMDGFACQRQKLVESGEKFGKTLSINWPLWSNGGMQVEEAKRQFMKERFGIATLEDQEGVACLVDLLRESTGQVGLLVGDRQKVAALLGLSIPIEEVEVGVSVKRKDLKERLEGDLLALVGRILKIDPGAIEMEEDLGDYGFDSISLTEFGNAINETYELDLTPALFFEHRSLASFVNYLVEAYSDILSAHFGQIQEIENDGEAASKAEAERPAAPEFRSRFIGSDPLPETDDIAIVGMSGVLPKSPNLEAFWRHLVAGDDLVSDIPSERWNWEEFCSKEERGRRDVALRYGGFIPDIDRFDAAFFGIAPHEARLMDPQHRLFLQLVWQALEDAGIAPSSLAGTNTGLFVGVANFDYNGLIKSYGHAVEAHELTGTAHSILANRISYLLDIHGASEPIDTACSSSLVAIDRGIEAIRSGRSDTVIVGGVNVLLSPDVYVAFNKAGMLSSDGRCKAFDASANGYVRGEGGGALILKSLRQARRDGNPIHALIKASGVNHGGKAQSLTAPNPAAQGRLLQAVYERAGIPLESIGYIEAHGTGTALGDPVEIAGLKQAFEGGQNTKGDSGVHCGLGTVKSNIGHLETAAGIAGVLKVIMALKERQLPKTLHFSELNPHIDLKDSPFFVVDRHMEWPRPKNRDGIEYPRRAGVSSFGFGGVNAHVVLEEYVPIERSSDDAGSEMIVLSARTEDALRESASRLASYLITAEDVSLTDLAFTLRRGRDAMRFRAACVVDAVASGIRLLTAFGRGELPHGLLFQDSKSGGTAALADGWPSEPSERALWECASDWVLGKKAVWPPESPSENRFLCLPTYPFARSRFWLDQLGASTNERGAIRQRETEVVQTAESVTEAGKNEEGIGGFLTRKLGEITGLDMNEVDPDTELADLGLDSILGMQLLAEIEGRFDLKLYPNELMENNTLEKLAGYLEEELARQPLGDRASATVGRDPTEVTSNQSSNAVNDVNDVEVLTAQELPTGVGAVPRSDVVLKQPLIFLLSAPRSGSTLLRVMLDGHPKLYAPPELHLLPFANMAERAEHLTERHAYLKEGLVKAVADLKVVSPEEAQACVTDWERRAIPIVEVYQILQELAGERLLVDKSPSYGMDIQVLERAAGLPGDVFYLHLLRHPLAVIESLVRNRFDRLLGSEAEPWDFANEVWVNYNRNIDDYLEKQPNERVLRLYFEDLVQGPERQLARVCGFLGQDWDDNMRDPYRQDGSAGGLHSASMAIGDPNFGRHSRIEPELADWTVHADLRDRLDEAAVELAARLGFSTDPDGFEPTLAQLAFLESAVDPEHWFIVQEMVWDGEAPVLERLQLAVEGLCQKHAVLGWGFRRFEQGWRVVPIHTVPKVRRVDWSHFSEAAAERKVSPLIDELRGEISLENGPLLGGTVVKRRGERYSLFLVVHHLVSDGVSMNLFHAELGKFYADPRRIGSGDRRYVRYGAGLKQLEAFSGELTFWRKIVERPRQIVAVDWRRGANNTESERSLECNVMMEKLFDGRDIDLRRLLPAIAGALGGIVAKWNDTREGAIALRMHRRTGVCGDCHNVFGFFAGDVPLVIPHIDDGELGAIERLVHDIPSGGNGYQSLQGEGLLPDVSECSEVRLNFQPVGAMGDRLIRSTVSEAPRAERPYVLDFVVRLTAKECRFAVRYSVHRHRRTTIEQLMERLIDEVSRLLSIR